MNNKTTAQALATLGLQANATRAQIDTAFATKKATLKDKQAQAPTPALQAKFATALTQLESAYQQLSDEFNTSAPNTAEPSTSNDNTMTDNKTKPSPLSQTKLADLPGLSEVDLTQVELQIGETLANRYQIKELIGQGGMGAVYRAFDGNRDEDIALKVLLPSLTKNERALERFLNEARVSSKLSHPNIVNVFDVQNDGDLYFLTMELLEGQDLRQVIDNQKAVGMAFSIDDVKEYLNAITQGLSNAHESTVHRDIKPENIWVGSDGKIKLMDFGIAQLQSTSQRTQTGAAMGTAYYMAPEQLKGLNDIDGRADQYAVSVLAYELLTGEVPAGAIEPISDLRTDLPTAMADAIMQGLAPKPDKRFTNIQAYNQAIQGAHSIQRRNNKKSPTAAGPNHWVTAALVLLLIGGLAGAYQQGWLDNLKPIDQDQLVNQQAHASKLQGQITGLQNRLQTSIRKLSNDVNNAKRDHPQDYQRYLNWEINVETLITNSSTLTDLQGEQAVGENYLKNTNTINQAINSLEQVKQGYADLFTCFQQLDGFDVKQQNLKQAHQQLLATGFTGTASEATDQEIKEILATEQKINDVLNNGASCELVALTDTGLRQYAALTAQQSTLSQQQRQLTQAQSQWQAFKRKYTISSTPESVKQGQQAHKQAQQAQATGDSALSQQFLAQSISAYKSALNCCQDQVKAQQAQWAREQAAKEKAAREKAAKEKAAKEKAAREQAIAEKYVGKMVTIPSGRFQMGSNNGDSDEKPIHEVRIDSFKMQAHEVTWKLYQPCIDAGVCAKPDSEGWGKGNRPVINVSWDDIQTYIQWLNQQTGERFRLPSEAQWEYAARAGTSTPFNTGNCITPSQANYDGNYNYKNCPKGVYREKTIEVGSFAPNAWGLYDMHGNVWEWVQDCWNGSYRGAPSDGSAWITGNCDVRVLRGGSWYGKAVYLRAAIRGWNTASSRNYSYGFRLVQDR